MEKKSSEEKTFVVEGHEQVEIFANAVEACFNTPREKVDVDVVRLRGKDDIREFIIKRFGDNLNMEDIKSKIARTVSTKEALEDVVPMEWDEDVIEGKKKVVLTSPVVAAKRGK